MMDVPVRVQELVEMLQGKGFTPTGYAVGDEHYVVQVGESG
jgi:hypothetical protein